MTPLPETPTTKNILDRCTACTTKEEAAELLRALSERCAAERPCSLEEAEKITRSNIGYLGGYCSVEVQKRFEELFGAVHPYFGPVGGARSPKTAQEAFELGIEIADARRRKHDAG